MKRETLYSVTFSAMGSPCQIRLFHTSQAAANLAAAPLIAEIQRLEQLYSRYLPTSLLSQINRAAGLAPVKLDAETCALLAYADQVFAQSEGLFDITSGVLRRAWDFKRQQIPEPAVVQQLLGLVGWDQVSWQMPEVYLPQVGMELDLGGFVKEYAADAAAKVAQQLGVERGLVELGGDIRIIGSGEWTIGIRNPHAPKQALFRLQLAAGGFASSGSYERCIQIDGVRYSHILNPRTGWPVVCPASVSVIADNCLLAGTVTTVALLKGEEGCLDWLEEIGLPYFCVFNDGRVVNRF